MITLELFDGEIKKLNLPKDKEKKLFDLWNEFINKKIKLTTNEEEIEIKLIDIENCYIGEAKKQTESLKDSILNSVPDFMKNMLFGGGK